MKHKAFRWMVIMLCAAMLLPATVVHAASAVAGLPAEVAAYPGDRTIVLQWRDPDEGPAGVYQIRVGEGSWISYTTDSLMFDAVNGKWVHLFGGLTNGREYTFRIRALDGEGLPGPAIMLQSTPVSYESVQEAITDLLSLQDIPPMQASLESPRLSATDLYAIHGIVLMPPGGWTGRPDPGEGLSRDKPYKVTMTLDAMYNHSYIIRTRIIVGEDAEFALYSANDWSEEVSYVDRLDEDSNWMDNVHVYIKVSAGSRLPTRYYDVTVKLP